jgi:hypothetical protein
MTSYFKRYVPKEKTLVLNIRDARRFTAMDTVVSASMSAVEGRDDINYQ